MKFFLNITSAIFLMLIIVILSRCKEDDKKNRVKQDTKKEPVENIIVDTKKEWNELKNILLTHYQTLYFDQKREIKEIIEQQVLIQVSYYGYDSKEHFGHIICNQSVKNELEQIFKELYALKFPIYGIKPISEFNFSDSLSMQANNTTCFDYRLKIMGNGMSKHASGVAIDINPIQNPYVYKTRIEPKNHQSDLSKGRIRRDEEMGKKVIEIFKKYGWKWGGNWRSAKDYMHFEK